MTLGAMKAVVPVAPVNVPYSLMSSDFSKLRHVFELTRPRMILAAEGQMFERALRALDLSSVDVVTCDGVPEGVASFHYGALLATPIDEKAVRASMDEIGHDTVAKYLFTSGSTGMPKGVTVVHWITERVGLIDLPLPGITLKLVPNGTKLEVRVKGPMVTPGYLNDPKKTKEAFDEEGFYSLGDATRFLDPDRPEEGLVFDGRAPLVQRLYEETPPDDVIVV